MLHVEWQQGVVTFTVDYTEDLSRINDSGMVNQTRYFADTLNKYIASGRTKEAGYMLDCLVAMIHYNWNKTVPVIVYENANKILVFYRWDLEKYVTSEVIPPKSTLSAIAEIISGDRQRVNNYKDYVGVCPTCGKKLVVAPPKRRGHPFKSIVTSCSCGSKATLLKEGIENEQR